MCLLYTFPRSLIPIKFHIFLFITEERKNLIWIKVWRIWNISYNLRVHGNPLQCSCLENPRDGGAWWAAVYGVEQSWTRLKGLSSSEDYPIIFIHFLDYFVKKSSYLDSFCYYFNFVYFTYYFIVLFRQSFCYFSDIWDDNTTTGGMNHTIIISYTLYYMI